MLVIIWILTPCWTLKLLQTLQHYSQPADISLIEANKGLYDGVALDGSDSNAAMAKLLESPVVLVINAVGTTRGVAPLLLGYQLFDPDINIAGVIYNLVGGVRHEKKLRQVTENYTDIPVLGTVHKNALMQIEERHLGLMPSNEAQAAQQQIETIADLVKQQVDIQALIEIAQSASPLQIPLQISRQNLRLIYAPPQPPLYAGYGWVFAKILLSVFIMQAI